MLQGGAGKTKAKFVGQLKKKMAEATPERPKQKRRRSALDNLRDNSVDERYSKQSLKADSSPTNPNNLQPRTLAQMKATFVSRFRQGITLSINQREAQFDFLEEPAGVDRTKLLPGMANKRREAFAFFYTQVFASPRGCSLRAIFLHGEHRRGCGAIRVGDCEGIRPCKEAQGCVG